MLYKNIYDSFENETLFECPNCLLNSKWIIIHEVTYDSGDKETSISLIFIQFDEISLPEKDEYPHKDSNNWWTIKRYSVSFHALSPKKRLIIDCENDAEIADEIFAFLVKTIHENELRSPTLT